jgi:hypothetical protein
MSFFCGRLSRAESWSLRHDYGTSGLADVPYLVMSETNLMKTALKLLFGGIFVWMVVMTIRTSLKVSLWSSLDSFAGNPWAVATLWDAYFGFITFWVWVAFKERTVWARALWLVLILALGNIAMSFYVLIQLFRLKPEQPVEAMLRR